MTDAVIRNIEEQTRQQHQTSLWYELRYGRITAARAYEVSRCKTNDGSLISLIMGAKIPNTAAMKRGKILENEVREIVALKLGIKIRKCGLLISKNYPIIAGSPDGICKDAIVEIKCPTTPKTYKTYIQDGKPTKKFYAQVQLQMYLAGLSKCHYCVADCNFTSNKNVEIINVAYNETYLYELINVLVDYWKTNVYPSLYSVI